ncbi:MAG: riboflavin biosynthesis protein RibF [Lachnospiraceae bacterium]
MIVIKNKTEFFLEEKTVVTIGKFDGFHRGHRRLLEEMKQAASANGWKTVIFTFANFSQNKRIQKPIDGGLLMSDEEKENFLSANQVDYLVEYPFDESTRLMEAEFFMKKVLHEQLNSGMIVVGTDFRFGKGRRGTPQLLEEWMPRWDCQVRVIEKAVDEITGQEISSTLVRSFIKQGQIEIANRLMGHSYSYIGEVIHGRGLAHRLGFPTMNIEISEDKLVPPYGVYSASAILDGKEYSGILNIGCKPTITDEKKLLLELFLFHYNENAYGKKLQVMLHSFVRGEMKFETVEALRQRVLEDVRLVRQEAEERKEKYNEI